MRWFVLSLTLLAAASLALAQHHDPHHHHGLDPYDIRLDDADARQAIEQFKAHGPPARIRAAAEHLSQQRPDIAVTLDDALGTPGFIRSNRAVLTGPLPDPADAPGAVKRFITDHEQLFTIAPQALDDAVVLRDGVTRHNNLRTIWWEQRIDGVTVHGADLRANILPDGRIVSIGSRMVPAGALDAARNIQQQIAREQAVKRAADNIAVELRDELTIKAPPVGPEQRTVFHRVANVSRDIETRRVHFPITLDDVRPAHIVRIGAAGDTNLYDIIVDAEDGRILKRTNLTWYGGEGMDGPATYRVWTGDSPTPMSPGPSTPDGTQPPVVPRELVTLEALDPIASPIGWIMPGLNETLGNNVDAHTDLNANNLPDLPRPQGSPFRVFDFPIDLSQDPSTYRDASVVQGFYIANWYHDLAYQLGFTEEFGNFQLLNFDRGGVEGDRLQLDIHDGGGVNNANFTGSGADGGLARVQMFLWDGPTPWRDGALDTHILIHELTHGTSIRLHGGLSGAQARGMGEGWSDFYAFAMTATPADDPHGVYAMAAYSTYQGFGTDFDDNYYFGIRRYPYSTDMSKNPLTYAQIDPDQFSVDPDIPRNPVFGSSFPNQVHNIGEVWCSALWECRALLMEEHGFAAGNQLMLQLVTDGMKLTTTSSPSMVQARDAILLADLINNDGANVCTLWEGFAKRGLGGDAQSPSVSAFGVVESFDVPIGVDIFALDAVPTFAQAGEPTTFTVGIAENCGSPLLPGTARLVYSLNGGPFESLPLSAVESGALDEFTATIPPLACDDQFEFYLAADTLDGVDTLPENAPDETFSLLVVTEVAIQFEDDFEDDLGWIVSGDATAGHWERGVPMGNGDRGDPVTDADGSGQCYLTENGPGNTDVDNGVTTLTSPTLDASGEGEAHISYYIWYSNDLGTIVDDTMTIEISNNDGLDWTLLEELETTTNGWEFRFHRIADALEPTSAMRIRFNAIDVGGGSIVEAAVDGVAVELIQCELAADGADLNGDGAVDGADLAILLAQWGTDGSADLNNDGTVDGADLAILLANWSTP